MYHYIQEPTSHQSWLVALDLSLEFMVRRWVEKMVQVNWD